MPRSWLGWCHDWAHVCSSSEYLSLLARSGSSCWLTRVSTYGRSLAACSFQVAEARRACRLTIHSSRTGFAGRLNSGVRPRMSHIENSQTGSWPDPPIPDLDSDGHMHPPWIKFPNLPRRSSGWRMGMGVSVRPRHLPCRSDQAHSHAP